MLGASFNRAVRVAGSRCLSTSSPRVLVWTAASNNVPENGALNALAAAKKIGGDVTVLVTGDACADAAKQIASVPGVSQVLVAQDAALAQQLAENVTPIITQLCEKNDYTHVLAAATTTGKNVAPRVAAALKSAYLADVSGVESPDTFQRPVYAGNAVSTVQVKSKVATMTVRAASFDAEEHGDNAAAVEDAGVEVVASDKVKFVSEERTVSERPPLASADRVVSGGRGLKSGENFEQVIYPLADALGAGVGASRAAVDAGYVPNDMQVGQTGQVVAPSLYVAVGISGAIQHLAGTAVTCAPCRVHIGSHSLICAGMKDSKTIVAINKDPEAPIFQVADYGLVADLFDAVPELTEKLQTE
ncbi:MAG: hypothetical protein MHM6MM_002776 [Cercozoa sp. M6MM]